METVKTFISALMSAVSNCSLYSKDHTSVDEFTRKSLAILDKLLNELTVLEIMLVEDDLIINKTPFRGKGLQGAHLIKRLKRKGLSRVEFLEGITFEELRQFIAELIETSKTMSVFPHIRSGVLSVQLEEAMTEGDFDSNDVSSFASRQAEMVKEIYHNISHSKTLNIARLNGIIGNFISAIRKKANILKLLSHAKSLEEYTYIHATNVSVLSIFQLESLGVREKLILHDVGIAGLLHDVGKSFISLGTLSKKITLEEKEWAEIKLHPLYGARYLSSIEELPHLATVVAFQHHLRYDGHGYPELRMSSIKQHILSQTVAISDFFDALRSARPYRKGLEIKEVLALMKKEVGRAFDPFLLDNFIRRMHKALSE
jgi:HD-GYP domain-containing protein (c-di-GMP phosphodiesterase class II)